VARHIFQACPVWMYTQSNITQASYSPEYITPTQRIPGVKINYYYYWLILNPNQFVTNFDTVVTDFCTAVSD
jgi:hypothetical protein